MTPLVDGFKHEQYRGLYLSCKLIKQEMDRECIVPTRTAMRAVTEHPDFLSSPYFLKLSEPPTTYSELCRVTIFFFHICSEDAPYHSSESLHELLSPLLELHLKQLVISVAFPQREEHEFPYPPTQTLIDICNQASEALGIKRVILKPSNVGCEPFRRFTSRWSPVLNRRFIEF
ncbi:hypothetical protein K458DRAFT_417487 [Lentithecium fluviatile CBS 122367]|uniref:Uncharacterized protein n=1 Tax=Lentithecium fluviatile CBS 122367 TaxID=1168545 RepID=A0A6G1J5H1_9PLEO|nr:hypothetical protein K458DRAFT_417487 [Lentithecium fluviatile CBS 122367]